MGIFLQNEHYFQYMKGNKVYFYSHTDMSIIYFEEWQNYIKKKTFIIILELMWWYKQETTVKVNATLK